MTRFESWGPPRLRYSAEEQVPFSQHQAPESTPLEWAQAGVHGHTSGNRPLGGGRTGAEGPLLDTLIQQIQAGDPSALLALADLLEEHGAPQYLQDIYRRAHAQLQTGQILPPGTMQYSAVRSPMQGAVVRGIFYPGGRFLPHWGPVNKASYANYRNIEDQRDQLQKYRRGDGSYKVEGALTHVS